VLCTPFAMLVRSDVILTCTNTACFSPPLHESSTASIPGVRLIIRLQHPRLPGAELPSCADTDYQAKLLILVALEEVCAVKVLPPRNSCVPGTSPGRHPHNFN